MAAPAISHSRARGCSYPRPRRPPTSMSQSSGRMASPRITKSRPPFRWSQSGSATGQGPERINDFRTGIFELTAGSCRSRTGYSRLRNSSSPAASIRPCARFATSAASRFSSTRGGCHIWDVDGRELIDYVGTWGPAILGHAPECGASMPIARRRARRRELWHPESARSRNGADDLRVGAVDRKGAAWSTAAPRRRCLACGWRADSPGAIAS